MTNVNLDLLANIASAAREVIKGLQATGALPPDAAGRNLAGTLGYLHGQLVGASRHRQAGKGAAYLEALCEARRAAARAHDRLRHDRRLLSGSALVMAEEARRGAEVIRNDCNALLRHVAPASEERQVERARTAEFYGIGAAA